MPTKPVRCIRRGARATPPSAPAGGVQAARKTETAAVPEPTGWRRRNRRGLRGAAAVAGRTVQSLLARIARLDPQLNVFIRLDADFAMDAARHGRARNHGRAVARQLHGVPMGIKDIFDVAGLPTTCNSRLQLDNCCSRGCACRGQAARGGRHHPRQAGTHEFAIGGPSFDLPFPPPRNPWNRDHHPGGLVVGFRRGARGGLVSRSRWARIPAGRSATPPAPAGSSGLKPSFGLVSRAGVSPLSSTLDHAGPMARSAADVALLLDAIAGHDPARSRQRRPARHAFGRALGDGVRGLRVGFVRHFHETDLPADPQVVAAWRGRRSAGRGRGRGGDGLAAVAGGIRRGAAGHPRAPRRGGCMRGACGRGAKNSAASRASG